VRIARASVHTELNARDDNPLVSVDRQHMFSNGNFHPLVLALAFESLRVAVAHAGMVSERRMNKVASFSFGTGLLFSDEGWTPGRYAEEGVLAYSAAALLARLKHLAMPVTLGSPPLDLDIEDHATLAPLAVTMTREALHTLETILTIEALLAVDKLASLPARRLGSKTERTYLAIRSVLEDSGAHPVLSEVVERVRLVLRT
jgi:histidine ammonia-lyase